MGGKNNAGKQNGRRGQPYTPRGAVSVEHVHHSVGRCNVDSAVDVLCVCADGGCEMASIFKHAILYSDSLLSKYRFIKPMYVWFVAVRYFQYRKKNAWNIYMNMGKDFPYIHTET